MTIQFFYAQAVSHPVAIMNAMQDVLVVNGGLDPSLIPELLGSAPCRFKPPFYGIAAGPTDVYAPDSVYHFHLDPSGIEPVALETGTAPREIMYEYVDQSA